MEYELLNMLGEKPIKSYIIEEKFHLNGAEVREIVRSLRRKGYPICSGSKGYWLGDREEIAHTIAQLRSRGTDMLETARAMEAMEVDGQLEAVL